MSGGVIVVIGTGQIGQAIARRVGVGRHVLLSDLRRENAEAAAEVLANVGGRDSTRSARASSSHHSPGTSSPGLEAKDTDA